MSAEKPGDDTQWSGSWSSSPRPSNDMDLNSRRRLSRSGSNKAVLAGSSFNGNVAYHPIFHFVDLSGRTAEARPPVVAMMAMCLKSEFYRNISRVEKHLCNHSVQYIQAQGKQDDSLDFCNTIYPIRSWTDSNI
ncbi:hypothetical protein [Labrys miyagiensis]